MADHRPDSRRSPAPEHALAPIRHAPKALALSSVTRLTGLQRVTRARHAPKALALAACVLGVSSALPAAADGEPGSATKETSRAPTSAMAQRASAQDHIGSWSLDDGSVVFSTGQRRTDAGFDPTLPQTAPAYPLTVMPFIGGSGDDPGRR